ncbi:MAG: nitroreductase family deazaflavin-dependent oxidoreductase [Acidimicrobiales bacterium]
MAIIGEYEPSTTPWVAEQVERYEASGGSEANTLMDTGIPIVIMTTIGHRSGKVRKVPVMRVEHDGAYAIVASKGGAPHHPGWYHNLVANPDVMIQDGPTPFDATVTLVSGATRDEWWARAVEVFPPYAEYQEATDREIPVFIARPRPEPA